MLPLIPIALSLVPSIAKWIAGDSAGETAQRVADVVRAVTGTEDPTEAKAKFDANPELVVDLQVRLAEIEAGREDAARQAQLDEMKAVIADVASARQQTVALAGSGSFLAYGSMILSGIILVGFSIMLYVVLSKGSSAETPLANVLLGTLAAMATQVANYWLGSSSGSASKNVQLASAQAALATSVPVGRG